MISKVAIARDESACWWGGLSARMFELTVTPFVYHAYFELITVAATHRLCFLAQPFHTRRASSLTSEKSCMCIPIVLR